MHANGLERQNMSGLFLCMINLHGKTNKNESKAFVNGGKPLFWRLFFGETELKKENMFWQFICFLEIERKHSLECFVFMNHLSLCIFIIMVNLVINVICKL